MEITDEDKALIAGLRSMGGRAHTIAQGKDGEWYVGIVHKNNVNFIEVRIREEDIELLRRDKNLFEKNMMIPAVKCLDDTAEYAARNAS